MYRLRRVRRMWKPCTVTYSHLTSTVNPWALQLLAKRIDCIRLVDVGLHVVDDLRRRQLVVTRLAPPSRPQSTCTYAVPCRCSASRPVTDNHHRPQTSTYPLQLQDLVTSHTDTSRWLTPPNRQRATESPEATPRDPSTGKTSSHVGPLITTAWYHTHGETRPELVASVWQAKCDAVVGPNDRQVRQRGVSLPASGDARPRPLKPVCHPGRGPVRS